MQNFSYENELCMQFHFRANQSHFHKNGCVLRLALNQRHKETRKWPIGGHSFHASVIGAFESSVTSVGME